MFCVVADMFNVRLTELFVVFYTAYSVLVFVREEREWPISIHVAWCQKANILPNEMNVRRADEIYCTPIYRFSRNQEFFFLLRLRLAQLF